MDIKFFLRFLQVFQKSITGFPQGFPQIYDRQNKANKSLILQQKDIPGREVPATSSRHFELPPRRLSLRVSNRSRTLQQAYRQEKERAQQRKNAVNCNSQKSERQGEQPDDWIKHQRQQSQRPAQDEQNAPQKKGGHGNSSTPEPVS
jgi:hypothetical protein